MDPKDAYPMVVIKLVVNEPSENRKSRQLFPTPAQYLLYINQNKNSSN